MKSNEAGFTLTELVVTITIVGILAAVAVPRLVSLGADARGGVIKSTAGAMKQANDSIFAKASIANIVALSSGASPSINYPKGDGTGTTVPIALHYGFAKDATELAKALNLTPDVAVGTDSTYPDGVIQHTKAQDKAKCEVGYTKAADSTTAPVYTVVVSDCS
ncbi:MAG: prepilin-type N-terminal cleavage/methylation domain-containing protein [Burkholderiales bacterium]|nr:prepilin-type N-terminal cleavage/methylation domain-containing protein [Burkholderiales bacterium]